MPRIRPLIVAFLVAPQALGAQVVVGTVREQGTQRPVLGAMVRLMADGTWAGELFLTAADGRYFLRSPRPGTYWLRVERIGFAETTVGPVRLGAGITLPYDIELATAPVRLEGIEVAAGRRRCNLRDDPAGETQTLWGEVRKALDAARWTEREAGLQFQVVRRTRRMDPSGRRVLDEERRASSLYGGNSVRTLPPDDLAGGGYVREEEGFIYYYGPDADVLLSDTFLATHCFSIVKDAENEPGRVGLAFDPMRGRDETDITGVLWVDLATARLERVEFGYTGLDRRPGEDLARGEVNFAELSDGRWIVRDWSIRAPVLGMVRQVVGGQLRERVLVTGVQEQGSEVISARGVDVEWRADLPWGRVVGSVYDSVAGRGLAGAEVAMGGRSRLTVTDSAGRFALDDVAPGTYWVTFDHPALDSLRVDPAWVEAVVEPDGVAEVRLAVPAPMTLLALRCGGRPAVVGTVRDGGGGDPVPGAVVTAEGAEAAPGMPLSAVTGADGGYWLCGAVAPDTLRLVARFGPFASAPVPVATRADAYVVAHVSLPLGTGGAETVGGAAGEGRATLAGTVVDAATRTPVEGVLVRLVDPGGAVRGQGLSDARGRVLIFPDEPGAYRVRTERLGYATTESAPLDLLRGTRRVEVRVSTEAIPLEEVVVSVRGTVRALELNGFYRREEQTTGRFLVREDLERLPAPRTSDILARVPGVVPVTFNEESAETTKRRIQFSRARSSVDWRCLPVIYVDGAMLRAGGAWSPDDPPDRWPTEEDLVGTNDIEAVELYNTRLSTPVRFQGPGSECGAVVIWTRRGPGG